MKTVRFINCEIDFPKKVFQPRIETGFWVEKAIKEIKKQATKDKEKYILDIFAGTGCIGIAVLKNIDSSTVDFVDIWPQAVEQIKINLEQNGIEKNRYKIYKSNLFEKLKNKRYDFIFANPPYVAIDRIGEVQKDVLKKDPHLALFAGKDGMVLIEKFFNFVKKHLKSGGRIFLEFDPTQKKKVSEILKNKGLEAVFKKDQFGKIRWLEARIKP